MASFVRNYLPSACSSVSPSPVSTRIWARNHLTNHEPPISSCVVNNISKRLFCSSSALESRFDSNLQQRNRRRWKNKRRANNRCSFLPIKPNAPAQHHVTTSATSQFQWPELELGPLSPVDKVCPFVGARGTLESLLSIEKPEASIKKQQQPTSIVKEHPLPYLFKFFRDFESLMSYESHVDRHTTMLVQALHHSLQPSPNVPKKENLSQPAPPLGFEIEYKLQSCPHLVRKLLNDVFPRIQLPTTLSVVTIAYQTEHDQAAWSPSMEQEREKLYGSFVLCAQRLCDKLRKEGRFWADFIDPGTGKPYYSAYTQSSLFETDDAFQRLGFHVSDVGCCKFIEHTTWGTKIFVGVLFTNAPHDEPILVQLINASRENVTPVATDLKSTATLNNNVPQKKTTLNVTPLADLSEWSS